MLFKSYFMAKMLFVTYFGARGGLTLLLRSDLDTLPCRITSLVAPIGTTRVLCCSLGCQSSNTAGASSVVCQMVPRKKAFLPLASVTRLFCAAQLQVSSREHGITGSAFAQRLVCLQCPQFFPPPISRFTGVTIHPEAFLTKFPWLVRVSLFEIERMFNPGIRTRDLPIRRRRLYCWSLR